MFVFKIIADLPICGGWGEVAPTTMVYIMERVQGRLQKSTLHHSCPGDRSLVVSLSLGTEPFYFILFLR